MKKLWLICVVAAVGLSCAGTQKQSKKSGGRDEPKQAAFKPSALAATEGAGQKPVDAATRDFQAEADQIAQDMKGGKPDWDDVASKMGDVAKKHPGYGLAWYNMGVAYEALGKADQAENAYRRAMKSTPPVAEAQVNLAAMAVRKGDNSEAVSLLRDLVEKDPGAASARVAIASGQLSKGDYKQAEKLAKEALGRDPRNSGAYCVLAHAAVKKKDHRRARLVAAQGFKIDADAPCLHHALGLVALAENETAVALAAFEKAAAKDPKLVEARFQIAHISMGFKDFKKAIANYAAVTDADPKNAAAYVNLGVAMKGSGQFQDAEKVYLKAVEVAGTGGIAAAHFNLGVLYMKNLARHEDAKAQFKRYLQLADAQSDDPAFALIEEIDKTKALEEEAKRQEEEQKKQEEMEAKIAAEEAKRKAEADAEAAAEKKRQEEIDKKMKAEGEPTGPGEGASKDKAEPKEPGPDETPEVPAEKPPEKPVEKPKAKPQPPKKNVKPPEPTDPPKSKDFE